MVHGGQGGVAQCHVTLGHGCAGGLEERGVDNPVEGPGIGIDEATALADLQARGAQQLTGGGGLARTKEDAVAGLGTGDLGKSGALILGNVLRDGAAKGAVFGDGHVGKTAQHRGHGPTPATCRRCDGAANHHRASRRRPRTPAGTRGTGCWPSTR